MKITGSAVSLLCGDCFLNRWYFEFVVVSVAYPNLLSTPILGLVGLPKEQHK